ncbi:hypothetical protein DFA_04151 [Cavenderia fasciculata]|uniref:Cysteine proteinase n=1 Tax=Cavenderia fasciculata TaxID=261658 RepID=F4Q1F5_CACFS|nr:uncharacterized protein DFA_04151 [Cavenderia fasciculata]EGG18656.1 hypothetical protein DFA_04151 [Cavenderia fasciculata]|eukprot:XP_004366560.1 hypothetical protein DFA_04151 [Cavenderia fasciculata]
MIKKLIVAILLLVALASARTSNLSFEETQFREFQLKYNKHYESHEFAQKLATFKNSLKRIQELNDMAKRAKVDTEFGVNKFADLSKEEFANYYLNKGGMESTDSETYAPDYSDKEISNLPTSFDWRTQGAVTPVKDQGQCGSCWSFSTTGNVEGQWFLAGNDLTGLSEQNLVDCSTKNDGCNGGLMPLAYDYIVENNGIDTEASYPYLAIQQKNCQFNPANIGAKIDGYYNVSSNETQMQINLVNNGPLSIAADAAEWQYYKKGIFSGIFGICGKNLDHGILIVGYGQQTTEFGTELFWIIKNSWSTDWGLSGFMLIKRGTGECGINLAVTSAYVDTPPSSKKKLLN